MLAVESRSEELESWIGIREFGGLGSQDSGDFYRVLGARQYFVYAADRLMGNAMVRTFDAESIGLWRAHLTFVDLTASGSAGIRGAINPIKCRHRFYMGICHDRRITSCRLAGGGA